MTQRNFAYRTPANDPAGLPLAISIFADGAELREQLRADAAASGLRITEVAELAALLEGEVRALGEVVLVDCPVVDPARLAALARLDLRAAHCGARLIVSTSLAALEDIFACLDQSNPQLLIEPSPVERANALAQALADRSNEPRQRLRSPQLAFKVAPVGMDLRADDAAPLPDPRMVRRLIRERQMRARYFDGELFADPAWDILLDLTAARGEQARVSVTSLCIASGVPPTTALRWIGQMTEAGLLQRSDDMLDRRRAFITLTDAAAASMARYFAGLGSLAA